MAIVREDLIPSLIENTVMQKVYIDGVHKQYTIEAIDGCVLHDKRLDWEDTDPDTLEDVFKLGYTGATKSVAASYDFDANPYEFYAVPESDVPADQIFGSQNPDHEVI